MDPEDYRAESRARWEQAAAGWAVRNEQVSEATAPVTEWLVDAVDPQPGWTILEIAAGVGETGLRAAERVGSDGRVLITDGAEAMVAAAKANAERAGAQNVEVKAMEAEWLDLSTASVDGVLCRWGYMLLADPETALRETRRVLRPERRVALAAWDLRERNPWMGLLHGVLDEQGLVPKTPEGEPGPFGLAVPGRIEELLDATGFAEPHVEALDITFAARDLDSWWEHLATTSPTFSGLLKGLTPKQHYELRDAFDAAYSAYAGDDGSVELPARTLVASASA